MSDNQNSPQSAFLQEAASIKSIIYSLIDGGDLEMAKQILEQYSVLNPTDPEIAPIKSTLYPSGAMSTKVGQDIPDDVSLMKDVETIFILSGIMHKSRTGYIDSVVRKIKLMEDKWNYKSTLLTTIHNIEHQKAKIWLQTAGDDQTKMNPGTKIHNVFEYFQESYIDGLENKAVYQPVNDGNRYVEVSDGIFEVFKNDSQADEHYIRKEYYNGYSGCLRMVRFFETGKNLKDEIYDDWGYLNYIRYYDNKNNDRFEEKCYRTDGKLCIERFYEFTTEGAVPKKYIIYDKNGNKTAECLSTAELTAYYLDQIISEDKFYMIIIEDGLMSKAATMIKKKNAAKCIVVHNIFLNDAYDPKSKPQKFYKYLCENHEKFDGIIQLTSDAKDDFDRLYKCNEKTFSIPHPYPYEIDKTDFSKRNTKKAVIIARLDPIKQINVAVDVFSLVVQKLPDVILEIYGRGTEEENIRNKIKQHGMENNIFLKGFIDAPLAVFNTAVMFMMTSKAEGFGLTVMESICNGCPAFAFDVKYGPAEIIEYGKTGYLFKRFDINAFAGQIVEYLSDVELQKTMSGNCYEAAYKFSNDKFLSNWYNMTEALYNRQKQ